MNNFSTIFTALKVYYNVPEQKFVSSDIMENIKHFICDHVIVFLIIEKNNN